MLSRTDTRRIAAGPDAGTITPLTSAPPVPLALGSAPRCAARCPERGEQRERQQQGQPGTARAPGPGLRLLDGGRPVVRAPVPPLPAEPQLRDERHRPGPLLAHRNVLGW